MALLHGFVTPSESLTCEARLPEVLDQHDVASTLVDLGVIEPLAIARQVDAV